MRRREFIAGLGSAAAWPVVAQAQQAQPIRRIGVLVFYSVSDPAGQARIAAFRQALEELGWHEGRNVRFDIRWGGGDTVRIRDYAAELVALAPDVLLGVGSTVRPLRGATRTVPIVFAGLNDPVGGGVVASLARPGGNITGFGGSEYSTNSKITELLKQLSPGLTRAAVLRDPASFGSQGVYGAIQGTATAAGIEVYTVDASTADAIERGITAFASSPNCGLIVPPNAMTFVHREVIIKLAARYRLPAVYSNRAFVADGGLASYGAVGGTEIYRRAAGYVDRILRGEKPADLPVQAPTKYELAINLKTAKALGLTVPQSILVGADEVIE